MNAAVGETDLQRLLAGLAPVLATRPRAIRTQAHDVPAPGDAILLFREDEGTTVIVEADPSAADAAGGPASDSADTPHAGEPLWAQITLRIHSSLEAVGMMAAISAALAVRGVPCNVVSAYFHDHLFVPWTQRDTAMTALRALSGAPA